MASCETNLNLATVKATTASPTVETLTRRQREVWKLIVEGRSNKEIACILKLRTGTVKVHVAGLFGKLGLRRRAAVAGRRQPTAADGAGERAAARRSGGVGPRVAKGKAPGRSPRRLVLRPREIATLRRLVARIDARDVHGLEPFMALVDLLTAFIRGLIGERCE